jgi:CheY-like chemotaxis protein
MSLTGNLEDLPLLDILQIVSFSKKTGHLTIRAAAGDGAIVFRDGLVVCAFTWDTLPLDPRAQQLPAASRDRMLRTRIELALEQLIRLREGQFNFALSDELPATVESRLIAAETLATGINPQELLLDLARGMDEDRRNSTALLEASFAEPPPEDPLEEPPTDELTPDLELEPDEELEPDDDEEAEELGLEPDEDEPGDAFIDFTSPAAAAVSETRPIAAVRPPPAAPPAAVPAPAAPAEPPAVLLVDDEEDVRRVVAEHLTKAGYQVVESDTVDGAVKKAHRLGKADIAFVLVTDLGMPTSGGSSFQGGFEIVKRLAKMNLQPPVLMMTDTLSGAVQARAKQLRIEHFVFKPGLSKLDPEQYDADLRVFATKLHKDILPRLLRPAEPKPAPPTPARAASADAAPTPSVLSTEFLELQNRLRELRMRGEAGDIAGLVMKVAREFFERAVLFLVKDDEARGLAGFGAAPKADNLNLLARRIVIPLQEKSAFADVAASRKPFRGPATDDKGVQYLLGKVGRFKSGTVALLPLLTNRETIALLFGDNPESGAPLPRLEPLEVFINQAGIALENAFLQKKVLALQGQQLG